MGTDCGFGAGCGWPACRRRHPEGWRPCEVCHRVWLALQHPLSESRFTTLPPSTTPPHPLPPPLPTRFPTIMPSHAPPPRPFSLVNLESRALGTVSLSVAPFTRVLIRDAAWRGVYGCCLPCNRPSAWATSPVSDRCLVRGIGSEMGSGPLVRSGSGLELGLLTLPCFAGVRSLSAVFSIPTGGIQTLAWRCPRSLCVPRLSGSPVVPPWGQNGWQPCRPARPSCRAWLGSRSWLLPWIVRLPPSWCSLWQR